MLTVWPASAELVPYSLPGLHDGLGQRTGGGSVNGDVKEAGTGDVHTVDAVDLLEPRAEQVANSRGLVPAFFASCRAMFVAQSPCSRFFGRSTRTASGTAASARAMSPAATASFRQADIARESSSGVTFLDYRGARRAAESGRGPHASSVSQQIVGKFTGKPLSLYSPTKLLKHFNA